MWPRRRASCCLEETRRDLYVNRDREKSRIVHYNHFLSLFAYSYDHLNHTTYVSMGEHLGDHFEYSPKRIHVYSLPR